MGISRRQVYRKPPESLIAFSVGSADELTVPASVLKLKRKARGIAIRSNP
jgi:hypothetical protein